MNNITVTFLPLVGTLLALGAVPGREKYRDLSWGGSLRRLIYGDQAGAVALVGYIAATIAFFHPLPWLLTLSYRRQTQPLVTVF
jgi:hypothetical protein